MNQRVRGAKKKKLRISIFLTCNADGSGKHPPMVIGRAAAPRAFRAAKINADNLPVVYKHNKRAWMLSGLWYDYLVGLEKEMRKQGRHILLITDNCPSHLPPTEPPQNYPADAPAPLVLSHVYLPKNTTHFLQPLDAGIIRMFKAGYRRRFATCLVNYFDRTGEAPLDIDILQSTVNSHYKHTTSGPDRMLITRVYCTTIYGSKLKLDAVGAGSMVMQPIRHGGVGVHVSHVLLRCMSVPLFDIQ